MTLPSVKAIEAGTVPRLHQAAVVFIERLALGVHHLVAAPCLGNHHQHRVRQLAPGHVQKLEHVVEDSRVRAVLDHDRQNLLQIVAEQRRGAQRFARAHPVDVAAQRVDLAVVGDETERVRQRPRREGIGREPRMHQRQRRVEQRVAQVGKHLLDLVGREHALVHEGARRQARQIKQAALGEVRVRDRVLDALADDVELELEQRRVLHAAAAANENLPEHRLTGARAGTERGIVHRHVAPAEHDLAFLAHDGFEKFFRTRRAGRGRAAGTPARCRTRRPRGASRRGVRTRARRTRAESAPGCRRRRRYFPRSRRRRDVADF